MNRSLFAITLTGAALLAACGGGNKPGADSVTLTGRAVDGPLQGAFACYDTNDSHACDAGEPRSAATAADGSFTLVVPRAAAGRHAVVVEVPAEAVDADTAAPVGQAFVMRAPATGNEAAHGVFVSPLTTLVHQLVVHGGASLTQATGQVRDMAGLALSPLADFTAVNSDAARHAARVARLVQLAVLDQLRLLGPLQGSADRDGQPITAAAIEREVQMGLLAMLPLVAETAREPDLLAASGAALQALLLDRAGSLAQNSGLTPELMRAAATMQRLAEPPAANPPVATGSLNVLRYTSADDWFFRTLQSSADDNVADANNNGRFYDLRVASTPPNAASAPMPGIARGWAWGNSQASAADLYWNGSAWAVCLPTDRSLGRVRDAQGRNDYGFCGNRETGIGQRRVEDISGRFIVDVVRDKIRSFPGGATGVAFANWGPSNLSLYGSATFPPGSLLVYQSNTPLTTAPNYTPTASNEVLLYSASVSAGGDLRVSPSLDCGNATLNVVTTPAATLEDMILRMRGRPCIFTQGGTAPNQSTNPDEVWGFSTLSLGDIAGLNTQPAGTGNFYSTNGRLRVAFSGSNRALFYRCLARATNNGARNCTVIGLGTWSIQNLSDGRILSFSTPPALANRLNYTRVFVERAGRVYYGYKNPVGRVGIDVRLNLPAANAVLEQIGLPRIRPITQPGTATGQRAANLATLQGAWGINDATNATVFRFGPNGRFFLAEGKAFQPVTREQSGAELGWFDHDPATGAISTLLEVDSNLTSGTSHPRASDPPLVITPSALSVGSTTINRLGNDASGLVGMWAVSSATDLSVPHLVFYADGRVLFVDHTGGDTPQCTPTGEGPPGAEYASWSYNASTGDLTISGKIHDSNGCAGLFDSSAQSIAFGTDNIPVVFPVTFAPDRLTMVLGGPRGSTETWFRIPVQ